VSVNGIAISGPDAPNYSANTIASTTANISTATVTALVSADNKVYDGTTAATIATRSLNGVLGSDNVSLSGGTASFATKTVGTATTEADITARSLSVTATGVNKIYDGTTSATVSLTDNRLAGDSLTTSYTSASFATKNVGTTKAVSVSGIALSGTDAANYTANTIASATADMTARGLTVS